MIKNFTQVSAFAPATTSNLAVGFDLLGFPLEDLGDTVTLTKRDDNQVSIARIDGGDNIPWDTQKNTATVALQAMLDYLHLQQGFNVSINKQIPLSSGLGGSAASSVAAVVALNHYLEKPLTEEQLIEFALEGEYVASGARHGDNVIPCLLGGLTLISSLQPLEVTKLPADFLHAVFIHPDWQVATKDARAVLPNYILLEEHTRQSACLGLFISALYEKDYERIGKACVDLIIEPRRAHLIPYFYEVKSVALKAGALACSISGSGPTLFALARSKDEALSIGKAMKQHYKEREMDSDLYLSAVAQQGAKVIAAQ